MYPIAPPLLGWFYANRRTLPFREDPTPYHIWVSEIMLQQTRMTAVLPYYERFMKALPDIPALAACPTETLHKLWEGLGYYSRVNNLQKAAQVVCEKFGGELPGDYETLLTLPGIGPYTAGAIASISFGLPCPAVDGNVLRVFSRLYCDEGDITDPEVKKRCTERVMAHQPPDSPGDFNQALMEFGALVCTPRSPDCAHCPLREICEGAAAGCAEELPKKAPKKERKTQKVTVAVVRGPLGVLLEKRPEKGLLAGLWQPYMKEEDCTEAEMLTSLATLGIRCRKTGDLKPARHLFTHIEWQLSGWMLETDDAPDLPENMTWAKETDGDMYTLPSAFGAYRTLILP
ncbi:MAG: A/G-specific adenine glycosylase [Ruminococcaceae bacterium]|nr:A/G-specific adenine glycosylase [Oscillospiraceae bacterium]